MYRAPLLLLAPSLNGSGSVVGQCPLRCEGLDLLVVVTWSSTLCSCATEASLSGALSVRRREFGLIYN